MKHWWILFLLSCCVWQTKAVGIDTLTVYSPSMRKNVDALVLCPAGYSPTKKYPVVYLLHGYSDAWNNGWLKNCDGLEALIDHYEMIVVCPDGGFSSWYYDSPEDPSYKYETFITRELIPAVDSRFGTVADRTGRAVAGLSMGGHGAFYLAFRHQEIFGVAGSMSGGVDIRSFPDRWDIALRLGPQNQYPERWESHTIINMLDLLKPNSLALVFDCGTGDFFYDVNVALHAKLLDRKIPHDFYSRPGGHEWQYWSNAIRYQFVFWDNYFKTNCINNR